jgi:hypothetical protein
MEKILAISTPVLEYCWCFIFILYLLDPQVKNTDVQCDTS